MRLLLDTSVLIDHLRHHSGAVELLLDANERGDELWGVVLTRTEVLGGMRSAERRRTLLLLDSVAWIDVTAELADRAGELARKYRASHRGIDLVDYTIAAAAEAIKAKLVTRNVRHFPMFAGLEPAYR